MRNVTISLREDFADWLRVEAAKSGTSMSAFVAGLLEERMGRGKAQMDALEFFLSGPVFAGVSADLPKRDEIHDREALHRHEYSDLRARSGGAGKAQDRVGFTEADDIEPYLGREPAKPE